MSRGKNEEDTILSVAFFATKSAVKTLANCDLDELEAKSMVCGQNKRVGINLLQYANNAHNFRVSPPLTSLLPKTRSSVIFYGPCPTMNDFDLPTVMG